MDRNTLIIIIVVVAILLIGALALVAMRRRQTDRLRSKFGPEYGRAVEQTGAIGRAEAQLHQREKRVQGFTILPLSTSDRDRFVKTWEGVQKQFVDAPKGAVASADELLGEVMRARGYPVGDFEQQSADLSVDHPMVVQNYRKAHDIALRHAQGQADTEDLRQAMLCYRALFDELVNEPTATAA